MTGLDQEPEERQIARTVRPAPSAPIEPSAPNPPNVPDTATGPEPGPQARRSPCPIVGMGASAGGLEAFQAFFSSMPADSGMAFVLVQHLDPRHETLMPELLARHTPMPVQLVADDTPVRVNHVYVIPPNATLTIDECNLRVTGPDRSRGRRMPIDRFFRSLAEDQGDDAVGIVLSGTGTDGALGLTAIKEHGGLTLVQAPGTARYDAMPRSAVLTGRADHVLPVEEMPARLMDHIRHLTEVRRGEGPEGLRHDLEGSLPRICSLLRRRTGHDFSRYKQSTLIRRIRRRMAEERSESVSAYLEHLASDPDQIDLLFRDLLIGVTHFFRDPEAFAALERRIVPRLFEKKGVDEQVRVWIPGCATGEEAYTIAILLREHAAGLEEPPHVQIFATDIDAQALEVARQAWYPERIAEQIAPERLQRFFVRHGNMYQVSKEIREMCLFSAHNIITDPPFSRLDLISCRNLLIYLESDLQKKLLPLCHYALRSGGYLFLGPSESVASFPELFRTVDKHNRIFQGKDVILRPPVSFPLAERSRFLANRQQIEESRRPARIEVQAVGSVFERILLEQYSPACVLVNERGGIVYFSPRTGKYLEASPGTPSLDVLDMARPALRLDLRTALHRAVTTRSLVVHENVPLEEGSAQRVHLSVRPMPELGEEQGLFMVVFQDAPPPATPAMSAMSAMSATPGAAGASGDPAALADPADASSDASAVIRRLEGELHSTKDHLQAALEELESSNEELVSSNEELLSINEELQSANEELQTSKEELQSVNEELETINAELKKKIEELDRANSDLVNLFESTQIATLFIDRDLRIEKFTPAATDLFRLIDSDTGRLITDIAPRFPAGDLLADIKAVLRTLSVRERQVRLEDADAWYMLRVLPYRTMDNVIDGVVITFVEITELKRAQEGSARLAAIVESSTDAIIGKTLDGTVTSWNQGAERMYGYTRQEAVGRPISFLAPPERIDELGPILERLRRGERLAPLETERVRKDGSRIQIQLTVSPVLDRSGQVVEASAIARDITGQKRSERALRESEERYRSLVDVLTSVVWSTDADGRFVVPQLLWQAYTGQPWPEHSGQGWIEALHPEDRDPITEIWRRALDTREPYRSEGRLWHAESGRYRHFVARAVPLFHPDGSVREWVGTVTDVDDRKRAEQVLAEAAKRKDEFLAMLGHELRNPLAPIRNSLYLLARQSGDGEAADRARQTIERQVQHLTRLVDDLLDVSRISRGKILLRQQRLDLVALVRTTVDDHRSAAAAAGLELAMALPGLPESALWVTGDSTRLAQTIGNLLHNAIKFTDGGGRVDVSVAADPGGRTATVRVRDTGVGIDPDLLGRLFEPFHQAEVGLDRSRGGLGLGLALVKMLIELHGGSVAAHSEGAGHGTEMTLRLPLEDQRQEAPEPAAVSAAPARPLRCLVIEDNPDAAETMALLLELAGHQVEIAHDGAQGLEKARQLRPQAVLCDIGLPGGMDGYDVARALRADPSLAPLFLVALTGYGQEDDQRRALEAGFDVHLTKPADPEALQRLLAGLR
jgi:two-component system CheB/CheR fusion protein